MCFVNILDSENQSTIAYKLIHTIDKDLLSRKKNDAIISLARKLTSCQ